ncbi:MAG: hypothetical protein AAF499_11760 [Pseudomonadota bacterium]
MSQNPAPILWAKVFFRTVIFVVVCGLLMYLIPILFFGVNIEFTGARHDGYVELASMLVAGEGFRFEPGGPPVMHRPPLYPILLIPSALLSSVWREVYVIALNSVLAGATAMMLMLLALRLFDSRKVGYAAVCLYLISPWLYRLVSLPHTALLQSTLYLASSLMVLSMVFGNRHGAPLSARRFRRVSIMFGVFGGLLTLTHGVGFLVFGATLIALAVFVVLVRLGGAIKPRLVSLCLSLLVAACIAAPWVIRNAMVLPITVPVTTGASFNYFMGNVYWNIGGYELDYTKSLRENALLAGGVDEPAKSAMQFWGVMDPANEKLLADNMKAHMLTHPADVLKKSLLSLGENFFPITHWAYCRSHTGLSCQQHSLISSAHRVGLSVYYFVLISLALAAVVRGRQRWPAMVMFALGGLHIGPYLPLGQWAPHGIYGLSAVLLVMVFAAATLLRTPLALAPKVIPHPS